MIRVCDSCGTTFNSEGHENGEWLNLCHRCNKAKDDLGGASVSWPENKLQRLYKKMNEKALNQGMNGKKIKSDWQDNIMPSKTNRCIFCGKVRRTLNGICPSCFRKGLG